MKRSPHSALVVILCVLTWTSALLAQSGGGSISGKVTDEKGQPLAGAMVTVACPTHLMPSGTR